jgi:signal transduction histidine kinase
LNRDIQTHDNGTGAVENAGMTELTEAAAFSRPREPTAARGRWAVAGATAVVLLAVFGAGLLISTGGSEGPNGRDYGPALVIACLAFGLPGSVLVARGAGGWIGPLALAIAICLGLTAAATGWALVGLEDGSLPGAEALIWITTWCWVPAYCSIPTFLLLLLPDGRLASRRLRPLALASALAVALLTVGVAISPYPFHDLPREFAGASNPVEAAGVGEALQSAGAVLLVACAALSFTALVRRFRRAGGSQRDQLKWVALGATLTLVLLPAAFAAGSLGDLVFAAAMLPLPASLTVAVLRHRMWDVDLVINRSLVFAALTAAVVAGYVAVVSAIGGLVEESVAGIVAVAAVAVALQPLHRLVQARVNQLVYGDRDDPGAALRRLGERLVAAGEGGGVLPAVAETVARALRLPYVAVTVEGGAGAESGARVGELLRIPLVYRGERVGELSAAPREPGRGFATADREALETLARQVAVAAHGVRLTDDLRRSRERLVLAREEERRRLRHDLHDELGPTLAALALQLESAQGGSGRLDETLERAAATARESVAEVRRLVHDLRPAALDDLGLLEALRERALRLSTGGLEVRLEAPDELGPLPAAVEVAAYRIASEALANAARHARARRCTVSLARVDDRLELSVADDGVGFSGAGSDGVGLRSMRERAEELGGGFWLEPRPGGGAVVRASLPLEAR